MLELDQLIEQDSEKGTLKFRQTGIRANLISSHAWASMKSKMFQAFGSGAASILFGLGQFYGSESLGSFAKSQAKHPFDIFQLATDFGSATGWGKIKTEFSADTLSINVENCCFCDGIRMSSPVCYELAGIITEGLVTISKEQIQVKESECIAKGDPICKFEASITKKLREGLRGAD